MEAVIKALNPKIESFDSSCFNGVYQTGDIDEAYLNRLSTEKSGCGGLKVHPSKMEHSISISDSDDEEYSKLTYNKGRLKINVQTAFNYVLDTS